jgi:hypothetical protein
VICVSELTVNDVAGVAPNNTAVAPVNPVPANVTVVPPDADPETGLIAVRVGTGTYVNETPALVPAAVVTVTGTVPVPGGASATINESENTL